MNTSYVTNSSYGNLPLIDGEIDLKNDFFQIFSPGVYCVIDAGFEYSLNFPDPAAFEGERIVVTNKYYGSYPAIPVLLGGFTVYNYQWDSPLGTVSPITEIPPGKTYNFISNGDKWIALPLRNEDSKGYISEGDAIRRGGVYVRSIDEDKPDIDISIVPAAALDGETVLIINQIGTSINIYGGICNKNEYVAQDDPYILPGLRLLEIVSVGGVWRLLAIRS
jgi:hypothetical protein